jgi:hypothetical protein
LTKAQSKRMLKAIDSKAKRLWSNVNTRNITLSTADMIAIEKIVARSLKRLG